MLTRTLLASTIALAGLAASANAQTVATFADPAAGPGTPLFSLNAATGVFSGGWSGTGLTLLTPALPTTSYSDVTFVLSPLSTTFMIGGFRQLSGGDVRFFDSSLAEIFRITFSDATLTSSLSFGSSDFVGSNVAFSGSIFPSGYSLSNESFAFSFANPASAAPTGSFTVTSSFTSSADILIPAPGAALLAGIGGVLAIGRRRR